MKNVHLLALIIFAANLRSTEVPQAPSSAPTVFLIKHFDTLVKEQIITTTDLERLQSSPELINPVAKKTADSSSTAMVHHKQLEEIITTKRALFDFALVQQWATLKLTELTQQDSVKEEVHEDTQELKREMHFIPLPADNYTCAIDGSSFEIPEGIEIQDALVTQWQWVRLMEENPVENLEGSDTEETEINGKKIIIRANSPVTMVSMQNIAQFIEKLNNRDDNYSYSLPSVNEYQAMLQSIHGINWPSQLSREGVTNKYLVIQNQRIFDLAGTMWQFTRDMNIFNDPNSIFEEIGITNYIIDFILSGVVMAMMIATYKSKNFHAVQLSQNLDTDIHKNAHLVFGGSIGNATTDLLRPVLYKNSKGECISFRLVRQKKSTNSQHQNSLYSLNWDNLSPDEHWSNEQSVYMFIDDILQYIFDHQHLYSSETKNTLSVLKNRISIDQLKKTNNLDLSYKTLTDVIANAYLGAIAIMGTTGSPSIALSFSSGQIVQYWFNNQITDIRPLAHLRFLKLLNLKGQPITNRSALDNLTTTHIEW